MLLIIDSATAACSAALIGTDGEIIDERHEIVGRGHAERLLPMVADLLGGRVMAMFSPASTALPHIKAGTLRALAASSARRTSVAPDLPTVAESGLPGFETSVWFGLLAPAATPRDIIERLNKEVARAIGDGEVKKQFATQGIDAMGGTPEHFATYIREETAKWARVVQVSGARLD